MVTALAVALAVGVAVNGQYRRLVARPVAAVVVLMAELVVTPVAGVVMAELVSVRWPCCYSYWWPYGWPSRAGRYW